MREEETAAWVLRLQDGDEAAFDEIYAAYANTAVRAAALITGDVHLAQDITQESFITCMLNIGSLKNAARFKPWFFRILTRMSWQMIKRKGKAEPLDDAAMHTLPPTIDLYPSDRRAQYAPLYRALCQLSVKQRTAVVLYYFNDFSIREIAQVCAVPEASVKTRLFAARRRLKYLLQEGENSHEAKP